MATLETTIKSVQHDPNTGWYRIGTDHDKVKRLDTKHDAKAKEAFALMKSGAVAVIEYTPRPRHDEATGRTYQNYYYEKAMAKADGGSVGDEIPSVTPTRSKTAPDDAWRMALSTGAKIASEVAAAEPFQVQAAVAVRWAQFIVSTQRPPSDGFSNVPSGIPSSGSSSNEDDMLGALADNFPEAEYTFTDDDIPFGTE
jgi:hypothetical protein